MNDLAIHLQGLSKSYFKGKIEIPVLRGVDLAVERGEFLALMGPSGSGKTTMLNLVGGLDRPTDGRIEVLGTEITRISEKERARWRSRTVGFIFQMYHLVPVLTARENVELPLLLKSLTRQERRRHAEAALEFVQLPSSNWRHFPRQLSGGQEQRVAIARAIVTDASLLLADEPTGDLDAESAGEILDLMGRLNTELRKTVVLVTHDRRAAERAGRILKVDKGALVLEERRPPGSPSVPAIPEADAIQEIQVRDMVAHDSNPERDAS